MKEISTDIINEFIKSHGETVDINEFVDFIKDFDRIIISSSAPEKSKDEELTKFNGFGEAKNIPIEMNSIQHKLFEKYFDCLSSDDIRLSAISVSEFERKLKKSNISYYKLEHGFYTTAGIHMTGVVICNLTGEKCYIRDTFTKKVPADYKETYPSPYPPVKPIKKK